MSHVSRVRRRVGLFSRRALLRAALLGFCHFRRRAQPRQPWPASGLRGGRMCPAGRRPCCRLARRPTRGRRVHAAAFRPCSLRQRRGRCLAPSSGAARGAAGAAGGRAGRCRPLPRLACRGRGGALLLGRMIRLRALACNPAPGSEPSPMGREVDRLAGGPQLKRPHLKVQQCRGTPKVQTPSLSKASGTHRGAPWGTPTPLALRARFLSLLASLAHLCTLTQLAGPGAGCAQLKCEVQS